MTRTHQSPLQGVFFCCCTAEKHVGFKFGATSQVVEEATKNNKTN